MNIEVQKIVVAPKDKTWSQVHVFEPKDNKKNTHGSLLATISFSAVKEEIDIASFGKEVLLRLHESYYADSGNSRLSRLESAVEKVVDEFSDKLDLHIQAGVLVNKALLVAANAGQVCLFREQKLAVLVQADSVVKTVSGFVKEGDKFVFGSSQFWQVVPRGTLQAALGLDSLLKTVDVLAPIVHTHENNNEAIALFFTTQELTDDPLTVGLGEPVVKSEPKPVFLSKPKLGIKISLPLNLLAKIKNFRLTKPSFRRSDFKIKDAKLAQKAKTKTLAAAGILIVLLAVSLFFGSKKKKQDQLADLRTEIVQPAEQALTESSSLLELNPLQAKTRLIQAQEQLIMQKQNQTDPAIILAIDEVMAKIEAQLTQITGLQKVDNPELLLDLILISADIEATRMSFSDNTLVVTTKGKNDVYLVNTDSRKYTKKSLEWGGSELKAAVLINQNQWLVGVGKDSLVVNDLGKDKKIQELSGDWVGLKQAVGFESNVYLLLNAGVLKLIGIDDGLSQPRDYLKTEPEWQSTGMAIDGFVWVLGEDGNVYKYISGKRDNFVTRGLEELSSDTILYTDKELDNIYILDRQKTKIFQIDKSGEYQTSLLWPGMAGVIDFAVSEKENKAYLLTKDRIYTTGLGHKTE